MSLVIDGITYLDYHEAAGVMGVGYSAVGAMVSRKTIDSYRLVEDSSRRYIKESDAKDYAKRGRATVNTIPAVDASFAKKVEATYKYIKSRHPELLSTT